MKLETILPMPKPEKEEYINAFLHNTEDMGSVLGKNVTVLHKNGHEEYQPYLIVVNTKTGEQIKITF